MRKCLVVITKKKAPTFCQNFDLAALFRTRRLNLFFEGLEPGLDGVSPLSFRYIVDHSLSNKVERTSNNPETMDEWE